MRVVLKGKSRVGHVSHTDDVSYAITDTFNFQVFSLIFYANIIRLSIFWTCNINNFIERVQRKNNNRRLTQFLSLLPLSVSPCSFHHAPTVSTFSRSSASSRALAIIQDMISKASDFQSRLARNLYPTTPSSMRYYSHTHKHVKKGPSLLACCTCP